MKNLLYLFLFVPLLSLAQITGHIVNEFDEPVTDASVFWEGTSTATTTDKNGHFSITEISIPVNLIVQKENFETLIIPPTQRKEKYILKESIVLPDLEVQAISPQDKKYYQILFKDNLLGLSENAQKCRIKNMEKVRFSYDKASSTLRAFSPEILEIDNPALGYTLFYEIGEFELNTKENKLYSAGILQFKDYKRSHRRKYQKAREKAYLGSLQHFIKSLYHQTLKEEKFEVRKIEEKPNPDYPTEKEIAEAQKNIRTRIVNQNDMEILRRARNKTVRYLHKELISSKDILTKNENGTFITFNDILAIDYLGEKESDEFMRTKPIKKRNFRTYQNSEIWRIGEVQIFENGHFTPPDHLWTSGYFAFEKLADILPYDYSL